ncbi:MAG: DUF7901 domain-containing protein [Planctomycetota bacterium]
MGPVYHDMAFVITTEAEVLDFGDAPDPCYPTLLASDGARHIIGGPYFCDSAGGDSPDSEADGQPHPWAIGDDIDADGDDEDGVTFPVLTIGLPATVSLNVCGAPAVGAWVQIWIDFNKDEDWDDAGEVVYNANLGDGAYLVPVTAPAGSATGLTVARCRISTGGGLLPTGQASDGEVEDHRVQIDPPPAPKPPTPHLKWSQPPIEVDPNSPVPLYCGWDEVSYMTSGGVSVYRNWDANGIDDYMESGPWGEPNLMADVITLAGTERKLDHYDFTVYAPAGTPPYTVTSELYTHSGGPSAPIPGTACAHNVNVTGNVVLDCAPGSGVILPNKVWMVLSFSDPCAGWSIGEAAETGFTQDLFRLGLPWNAFWFLGNPYAGFEANIWCRGEPVVADDFRCLGTMPITSVHWWGSYLDWMGLEPPIDGNAPSAWLIGFWSNVPASTAAPVVYSADPGLAIPDYTGTPGVVSHTISVPDSFTVRDVDIDAIIDHTYLHDLIVTVEHLGEIVTLWNRVCHDNNNMDVIFDDEGNPVECNSPTVGDVIPFEALSAFDGMDSAGDWTITVSDNEGADTGTLQHWSVHLDSFSYPEELLHQIEVPADRVDINWVGVDVHPLFPSDTCFQYYVDLGPDEVFWQGDFLDQTQDEVFWLSIAAVYDACDEDPCNPWGWKTRPWSWMDDAVSVSLAEHPGPGVVLDPSSITPIKDPCTGESVDVSFELDTDPNYIKWEQPFTGIRNWPHYEDEQSMATRKSWTESKWLQGPNPEGWDVSFMGADIIMPLELADDWLCDETGTVDDIHFWFSWKAGIEGPIVSVTVTIWSDNPSGPGGYSEPDVPLWLRTFGPGEFNVGPGGQGDQGWLDPFIGLWLYPDHADFFHLSIDDIDAPFIQEQGNIYWLSIQVVALGPVAGWKTTYGVRNDSAVWKAPGLPWQQVRDDWGEPLDFAFELTTTKSQVSIDRQVADDWRCDANTPITAAVWWGSYIGYRYEACTTPQPHPTKPDYFLLTIWTDVPANAGDPCSYSHPNNVIWEYKAYDYDEVLVGYDKHPEQLTRPPREPVLRYSVKFPCEDWFYQDTEDGVYWFSVVAVYDQNVPNYDWGWTNHAHEFNDDAVAGHVDGSGALVWQELFDQTGESEDMSFVLFTDPDPELGTCWDICQCAGQPSGDATCDGAVNLGDLFALKMYFGQAAPWLAPECCSDFNHDNSVNLGDLFALKMWFGTGPYAPATGSQSCP